MTIKTLYTVLGLPSSAYPEDIEDAFNRLKLQYPKEKLETDENTRIRFLALQQAYETLSNPDARALYDQKLARAGVKVDTQTYGVDDDGAGWLSTRNIIVAGLILILISGMWVYHARQKAREERETVERLLRLAEEEKRRQGELQASEEARRQTGFEQSQQRQIEARERQFRQESERFGRQVGMEQQNAQRHAEAQRRQEQYAIEQRQRQEQAARQQGEYAAQRRLQEEKRQLRELCMQRYGRPDC
jgi:curved DNA-binding protein CbpA